MEQDKFRKFIPFLQENQSDFTEQKFNTIFDGREFFLSDHLVYGEKMLPGVVYLEMILTAAKLSLGKEILSYGRIDIENIVWLNPLVVNEHEVSVKTILSTSDNGKINYRICSSEEGHEVYNQGSILVKNFETTKSKVDIAALKKECKVRTYDACGCYDLYRNIGIEYGPAQQGIQEIYAGEEKVIARLALPGHLLETGDSYTLHPSLLDSALQSILGFFGEETLPCNPRVPYALEKLEVIAPCTTNMWTVIWREKTAMGEEYEKYHLKLYDENGNECVRLLGLVVRQLSSAVKGPNAEAEKEETEDIVVAPFWDVIPIKTVPPFPNKNQRILVVGGTGRENREIQKYSSDNQCLALRAGESIEEIYEKLAEAEKVEHIIWIAHESEIERITEEEILKGQEAGVVMLFRLLKAMLKLGYGGNKLGFTILTFQTQPVYKNDSIDPTNASIHGLVGSLAKEYPNWRIRVLDFPVGKEWTMEEIAVLPTDSSRRCTGKQSVRMVLVRDL